jgi:hypothetical protein
MERTTRGLVAESYVTHNALNRYDAGKSRGYYLIPGTGR